MFFTCSSLSHVGQLIYFIYINKVECHPILPFNKYCLILSSTKSITLKSIILLKPMQYWFQLGVSFTISQHKCIVYYLFPCMEASTIIQWVTIVARWFLYLSSYQFISMDCPTPEECWKGSPGPFCKITTNRNAWCHSTILRATMRMFADVKN